MKKPKETKPSSDEAVKAKTGKVWAEWFAILDKAGAKKMPHKEIAMYLHDEHKVTLWWCQMVSVAYEHDRGLRQKFQKCDGAFSASASRTIAVPLAKAFEVWINDKLRRRWLPDAPMEITTATPGKYVRAKWDEGTRLSVGFSTTPGGKTRVAVDHEKLANTKECEKMKSYWASALDRLESLLAS